MKLPLERIRSIECQSKTNSVQLTTTNGDTLTAQFVTKAVRVETAFGNFKLPVNLIKHIQVSPMGKPGQMRPGLVARWPGEGNANDIIGTNNGTLVNIAFTNGMVNQGFYLNGTSAYVQVADAAGQLNFDVRSNNFTVALWVNLASPNGREYLIIDRGTQLNQPVSYQLFFDPTWDKFSAGCWDNSVGNVKVLSVTSPTTNTWYHVAMVCDTGVIKLYVNGNREIGSPAPDGSLTNIPANYGSTRNAEGARTIGRYAGPTYGNYLHGVLDEVQVFNRALSSNEIAAIYNAGGAGECPPTPTGPTITTQPTNQTVVVGGTASFSVTASGTPPLGYQWSFDGTNIVGATNTTLTLTNVQLVQAGNYAMVVTNTYGSVTSSNAVLTVLVPPTIITQPTNQTVYAGGTASFSVTASGTLPLGYQWNSNGTNIVGATNTTLVLTNVQLTQAGNYAVLVSNPVNSILSSNAVLTVNPPPAMAVAQSGNSLFIFWPVSAPGFVLKSSLSLSPATWVPVSYSPIQIGDQYVVPIEMSGTNCFYRLEYISP
jgi:hypothetical protein